MRNYKNSEVAGGLSLAHPLILLRKNTKLSCLVAIETSNCCTWQIAGHFKAVNSALFLGSSHPTGLTCDSLFRCRNISCQQSRIWRVDSGDYLWLRRELKKLNRMSWYFCEYTLGYEENRMELWGCYVSKCCVHHML